MYCLSMVSLFVLRKKEPNLERPFKVSYPVVPAIALVLGVFSFFCVVKYNVLTTTLPLFGVELPLAGVILTIFGVAIVYYFLVGSKKLRPMSEEFVSIEV